VSAYESCGEHVDCSVRAGRIADSLTLTVLRDDQPVSEVVANERYVLELTVHNCKDILLIGTQSYSSLAADQPRITSCVLFAGATKVIQFIPIIDANGFAYTCHQYVDLLLYRCPFDETIVSPFVTVTRDDKSLRVFRAELTMVTFNESQVYVQCSVVSCPTCAHAWYGVCQADCGQQACTPTVCHSAPDEPDDRQLLRHHVLQLNEREALVSTRLTLVTPVANAARREGKLVRLVRLYTH
jgi:hypothetical protein